MQNIINTTMNQVKKVLATIPKPFRKNIIHDLAFADEMFFENGILYMWLDTMPFDADGRHATGRAFWNPEYKCWVDEYEE